MVVHLSSAVSTAMLNSSSLFLNSITAQIFGSLFLELEGCVLSATAVDLYVSTQEHAKTR